MPMLVVDICRRAGCSARCCAQPCKNRSGVFIQTSPLTVKRAATVPPHKTLRCFFPYERGDAFPISPFKRTFLFSSPFSLAAVENKE